jgi:S-adenosylmethionine hydrolase
MKIGFNYIIHLFLFSFLIACSEKATKPLVLMTDFGEKDGAVSAMRGVANSVSDKIKIYDLTHEIPNYNIFEGAYRLLQTAPFWQRGSVFVGVIDPGVGTSRKSIVVKSKANHYYVGPDNGLFWLILEIEGIEEVREIDLKIHRLPNSGESYTFFGRDVFSYVGAKLASGLISFEEIGSKVLDNQIVKLNYQKPIYENGIIKGGIPALDIQYGNVWTNIDKSLFKKLKIELNQPVNIQIFENEKLIFEGKMPYINTFGDVKEGENLCYFNSLMNVSFAINMGNFAEKYQIKSGENWRVEIKK